MLGSSRKEDKKKGAGDVVGLPRRIPSGLFAGRWRVTGNDWAHFRVQRGLQLPLVHRNLLASLVGTDLYPYVQVFCLQTRNVGDGASPLFYPRPHSLQTTHPIHHSKSASPVTQLRYVTMTARRENPLPFDVGLSFGNPTSGRLRPQPFSPISGARTMSSHLGLRPAHAICWAPSFERPSTFLGSGPTATNNVRCLGRRSGVHVCRSKTVCGVTE